MKKFLFCLLFCCIVPAMAQTLKPSSQLDTFISPRHDVTNDQYLFAEQLKLAKTNHIRAQFNIGVAYWFGCGVDVDREKAWYWLKRAANAGEQRAQLHIGKAFMFGKGTERRTKQGIFWLTKAAEQGNRDAQAILGIYYLRFNYPQAKDCALAAQYLSQAARQNQRDGQLFLGAAIASGRCFKKNRDLGLQWIELSAHQNQADAIQIIEEAIDTQVYLNGEDAIYWR